MLGKGEVIAVSVKFGGAFPQTYSFNVSTEEEFIDRIVNFRLTSDMDSETFRAYTRMFRSMFQYVADGPVGSNVSNPFENVIHVFPFDRATVEMRRWTMVRAVLVATLAG